jgi:hypothetical protein
MYFQDQKKLLREAAYPYIFAIVFLVDMKISFSYNFDILSLVDNS